MHPLAHYEIARHLVDDRLRTSVAARLAPVRRRRIRRLAFA